MPLGLLAKDSIQDLASLDRSSVDDDHEIDQQQPWRETAELVSSIPCKETTSPIFRTDVPTTQPAFPLDLSSSMGIATTPAHPVSTAFTSSSSSSCSASTAAIMSSTGVVGKGATSRDPATEILSPHTDITCSSEITSPTIGMRSDAANPQQAHDEDHARLSTTGQYAGFRGDYLPRYLPSSRKSAEASLIPSNTFVAPTSQQQLADDDDEYCFHHDSYAPVLVWDQPRRPSFFSNLLCCMFPWMNGTNTKTVPRLRDTEPIGVEGQPIITNTENSQQSNRNGTRTGDEPQTTPLVENSPTVLDESTGNGTNATYRPEEDENSSVTDNKFGEKLSARERQAVLARLGLAQPASDEGNVPHGERKKGLLNGIPTYDRSPLHDLEEGDEDQQPHNTISTISSCHQRKPLKGILKRGSVADLGAPQITGHNNNSDTSSTPSRRRSLFPVTYGTSPNERKGLKVNFAPMARVVTVKSKNNMTQEEKADVWWQRGDYDDFRKTGRIITKAILTGGSEIWLQSANASIGTGRGYTGPGGEITGDKWWHKFGHSRRGLEHVVSIDEGRDRQVNVKKAIHAVLEEQTRQKAFRKEDPEKLRIISLNHTSWARDLALAAGASDADAVRTSFAEDRKSREFYLRKMSTTKPNGSGMIPSFMQLSTENRNAEPIDKPTVRSIPRQQQQALLDANTAAQICFRRRIGKASGLSAGQSSSSSKEISEPIRDPDPDDKSRESLAHRAAGFMPESGKVDMAAALAGMGPVAQKTSVG